jgi:sigma-B regulation protein RsbU (phosphoserine phosphatase)
MKGGGDYFDVFEFADKNTVGFLLTDVSSYKLSSAFISTMMHLPASLGPEDMRDPVRTVGFIHSELLDRMGATDHMSIFYGVLDRKSFQMRYVAFGNLSLAFESARRERNWIYRSARSPLSSGSGELISRTKVDEMNFEPEDRLYLFSDGVEEGVGKAVPSFLDAIQDRDPQAVINEVSFAIRTQHDPKGEDGEAPMPPQDCSVLMLDVAKNILRLAR